ncbi:MAG: hypothetical protein AB9M60_08290 [Leptothrix sp. (in: b-proteobacteria)]
MSLPVVTSALNPAAATRWRQRCAWQARQIAERAGLPGLLVMLIALALPLTWALWIVPLTDQMAEQRDERALLQQRVDAAPRRPATEAASVPADVVASLAHFAQRFPTERGLAASLARLQRIATRHGIELPQGEFSLGGDLAEPLGRYSMLLPVKADYLAVRGFCLDVLREMPGVSLQDLNLKREDSASAQVEARLRFVLFVRRAD